MLLTLYDQYGSVKATLSPNDTSTQDKEVQGDNVLSLSFTLYEHTGIDVNDYVDFEGERYWAMEKYLPTEKSTVEWEYNVKLYGIESLIKRFLVLKTLDGGNEAVFTLTARPIEHVRLIVQNINAGMDHTTNFKVGTVEGTDNIVIDYTGKYCDEGLKELAEKVGVEWWIEGETVNLCRCESGEELTLGYGNGLTSLDRDVADNAKFYTRLFPIGSSRNIDPERYGASRLQLPGGVKYVDVNTARYGVIHHYEQEAFSGIYPRRVGVVSSVRSESVQDTDGNPFTIYYFKDSGLTFDPNAYEIGGLVKHVSFQEGSELAGLGADDDHYFEVNYNSVTREFEIITIWPWDDDTQLPGGTLVPKAGDRYILWNIRMPDEYYGLAEREFESAVNDYNAQHALDVSRYKAPTDHVWIEAEGADLYIGRRIRLESQEYFPDTGYRKSRITRISRQVTLPSQMDLEISDALSMRTLEKIDDAISDVKTYAGTLVGSLNVPDIIRSWDTTRPTDNNLYSARRSHKEFLSKTIADTARGKITFVEGLQSDKAADFGAFVTQVSGASVYKDDAGNWHVEADYLNARKKLTAKELDIEEVRHVGGQMMLTAAECVVDYVVEHEDFYRCYFLKEDADGKKIKNKWVAGDQALMQSFNVEQWSDGGLQQNRRYWRLVIGTSNDSAEDIADYNQDFSVDFRRGIYLPDYVSRDKYHFIDLSKTDCEEGSDTPAEGDKTVQLGYNYKYKKDSDRQNAIIIAGAGSSSPYIDEYAGIDSYTLDGKLVTRLRPGENLLTGRVTLQSGSTLPDGTNIQDYVNGVGNDITNILSAISGMHGEIEDGLDDAVSELRSEIETLNTGNENLLRNTGFTGDYLWDDADAGSGMDAATAMYSRHMKYWECTNAEVVTTANSTSGFGVSLNSGSISQQVTKDLEQDSWYCISFKGNGGSVYVSLGGYYQVVSLSETTRRYIVKFVCEDAGIKNFIMRGSCTLCDIQVTQGRIPNSDWTPSPLDNDKALAYYQNLNYLSNAVVNGDTTILGGLILSQMLRVGNYRDGEMTEETGGMSGLYMSGNSPFLWGGGDMQDAFYTIGKYADNPAYQPTDEEVSQMAKFVVTHGGRAILNDIVLRGYIYALGGVFKGRLEIGQTDDKFVVDSSTGELTMRGHNAAQDAPGFPTDTTSPMTDFFKLIYGIDPDTLYRVAKLILNSGIGTLSLDAADGLQVSHNGSQIITNLANGFHQKSSTYETQLNDGELVFTDKVNNKQMRLSGSRMDWFVGGIHTMGGTFSVDGNGYIKLLQD